MNAFERFVAFLSAQMTTPTAYGWYHLMCLAIMIGLCIGLGFAFRKASDKTIRIFLLCASLTFVIFEIFKQLVFSYNVDTDVWDYQWYAFPFQFCSSPMYVALLASIVKKGKFQDFLYSFLATFSLFAGLIVMIMPGDVFISDTVVNIQTMIHHGGMVVIGVVLFASKSVKFNHFTILKAMAVFATLVAIALLGGCIYVWAGGTETFNLFYINPYFNCHLPVFSTIQATCPYIIFLLSYLVGFSLAAYIVLLVAMGINKLIHVCADKRQKRVKS